MKTWVERRTLKAAVAFLRKQQVPRVANFGWQKELVVRMRGARMELETLSFIPNVKFARYVVPLTDGPRWVSDDLVCKFSDFADAVGDLTAPTIGIELDADRLLLDDSHELRSVRLFTSDRPTFELPTGGTEVQLAANEVKAVKKVAYAVSEDPTRLSNLHCVNVERTLVVATDGHRVAVEPIDLPMPTPPFMLRREFIPQLSDSARLYLGVDWSRMETDVLTLHVKHDELPLFPDWRICIPQPSETRPFCVFETKPMITALRELRKLLPGQPPNLVVRPDGAGRKLVLEIKREPTEAEKTVDPSLWRLTEVRTVPCAFVYDDDETRFSPIRVPRTFGVNVDYLTEALAQIGSGKHVVLELDDPLSPMLIRAHKTSEQGRYACVMPMRI